MQANPARRVYFHIGAPKTGTTYLQQVLSRNRPALRAAGLLYPGNRPAHFLAAQDLCGEYFQGHADPEVEGAWQRLVEEVSAWDGPALIDHENFVNASDAAMERAMDDLRFAEVHLVWTARDLARQLPAAWQEDVKNRATATYAQFLAAIRSGDPDSAAANGFWRQHGTPTVLERWSRVVPVERIHLVTVPPPGSEPTLLWQRFAGVLGLDPSAVDTDIPNTNTSLTAAESTVIRLLNERIGGAESQVPWPIYSSRLKHGAVNLLAARGSGERIDLPEDAFEWVVDWSRAAVDELAARPYDIIGDLAELIPQRRPSGVDPDTLAPDVLLNAATDALAALLELPPPAWRGAWAHGPRPAEGGSGSPSRPAAGRAARQGMSRVRARARRIGWLRAAWHGYLRLRGRNR